MKIINRKNHQPIIKKRIALDNIIPYEYLDLNLITNILNEVISQNVYSTLDLIQLLEENYQNDLRTTIKEIKDFSKVRFNCCYATRLLKNRLKEKGIDTKIISYKSIGFSTTYGDSIIKEAHMALLIPTKREGKIYYIILDPGLRIPEPIGFYENDNRTLINIENDEIIIAKNENHDDKDYPYSMEMKGYNRYSIDNTSYQCKEYFDLEYETLNPLDILFPFSYELLDGYRVINYSTNKDLVAAIKVMIIDCYLECMDSSSKIKINLKELDNRNQIIKIIARYAQKLNVPVDEIAKTIEFILENRREFIDNVIDKNIVMEKKLR